MHVVSVTRHSSSLAISMKRKTPRVVREELYKEAQGTRYEARGTKAKGPRKVFLEPRSFSLVPVIGWRVSLWNATPCTDRRPSRGRLPVSALPPLRSIQGRACVPGTL